MIGPGVNDIVHALVTSLACIAAIGAWVTALDVRRVARRLEQRPARIEHTETRVELPTGIITADVHLSEDDVRTEDPR